MKKISGYKSFFAKLDKIVIDLNEFEKEMKEKYPKHWGHSFSSVYDDGTPKSKLKIYKKNPLLNIGEFNTTIDKELKTLPQLSLWWTVPNYMGKATYDEVWKKSQRLKVIHSENGYDFVIIRDQLDRPTETYYGHKFSYRVENTFYNHKLAIMKKKKVIFFCFERWEFENFCEGIKYKERTPETPSEIFRYFNPFKILVLPFNDKKGKELCKTRYGTHCDNEPYSIVNELSKNGYTMYTEQLWVVHIMGMGRYSEGYRRDKHITTWFLMGSKTKPTINEALSHMMHELNIYDQGDFAELMVYFKDEIGMDMNKVNFLAEQRIMDLWQRKFMTTLEVLMNTTYKEIKEFWNENINF